VCEYDTWEVWHLSPMEIGPVSAMARLILHLFMIELDGEQGMAEDEPFVDLRGWRREVGDAYSSLSVLGCRLASLCNTQRLMNTYSPRLLPLSHRSPILTLCPSLLKQ
jgi:hypothetical protein